MTVEELIKELKKYKKDAVVIAQTHINSENRDITMEVGCVIMDSGIVRILSK